MYMKQSPPTSPLPTRTTSPLPPPVPNRMERLSATAKRSKYLRRLVYFRQMDFEFAMWQMVYLFTAPQKVYRNFQYRKQTKDQFARDDPAFLVLLALWLVGSSMGFALVLSLSFLNFLKFLLWVIFIDCIGIGLVIATGFWLFANYFLKKEQFVNQDVEWGYAFDVHLNAFFPLLVILHVFQLFFYHVLISQGWFISILFGNTLWLIAIGYYVYITFLGYSALPILMKTQVLLYPFVALFLFYLISIITSMNLCQMVMDFYHYRVL